MTIELQNKVWSILPKEFKEEVKRMHRIADSDVDQMIVMITLENVFGHHNLTSDEEGEEMLTVKRSDVINEFDKLHKLSYKAADLQLGLNAFRTLFGSKCLPGKLNEDNFAKSEPKFNIKNNKEMNFCEILKGHEGETFYSPCYGYITLKAIKPYCYFSLFFNDHNSEYKFTKYGKISTSNDADCVLFPSKDQRDWNKWIEEQNPKTPKIWNDMTKCNVEVWQHISRMDYGPTEPIVKSVLALLKIHQLIEVGYGGNVTRSDYIDIHKKAWGIDYDFLRNNFHPSTICYSLVAFHTEEQAKEFLSYPENIQLLKDYFQVD